MSMVMNIPMMWMVSDDFDDTDEEDLSNLVVLDEDDLSE